MRTDITKMWCRRPEPLSPLPPPTHTQMKTALGELRSPFEGFQEHSGPKTLRISTQKREGRIAEFCLHHPGAWSDCSELPDPRSPCWEKTNGEQCAPLAFRDIAQKTTLDSPYPEMGLAETSEMARDKEKDQGLPVLATQ